MQRYAEFQKDTQRNSSKNNNSQYNYSEEFIAEDDELVEVYNASSHFITLACILMMLLFTMFIIGLKLSGGKAESPKEVISGFFLPFRSDYYEIRVDNPTEEVNINSACVKFMEENGYSDRLKTSAFNRNTAMYLKQEDSRTATLPGSYGSTTFYIKPKKADTDLAIHIRYDVFAITELDNGSLMKMSEVNCKDIAKREKFNDIDNLLNGHILFFQENHNGKYSGIIENGEMIYRTSEHRDDLNSNGEYKVKVYWVWAEYYEQLVNSQANGALFDNSSQLDKMINYIEDNPNEFFCTAGMEAVPNGTAITNYDVMSDYYNNGDKLIVENTNYFGFNVNTYAEK